MLYFYYGAKFLKIMKRKDFNINFFQSQGKLCLFGNTVFFWIMIYYLNYTLSFLIEAHIFRVECIVKTVKNSTVWCRRYFIGVVLKEGAKIIYAKCIIVAKAKNEIHLLWNRRDRFFWQSNDKHVSKHWWFLKRERQHNRIVIKSTCTNKIVSSIITKISHEGNVLNAIQVSIWKGETFRWEVKITIGIVQGKICDFPENLSEFLD